MTMLGSHQPARRSVRLCASAWASAGRLSGQREDEDARLLASFLSFAAGGRGGGGGEGDWRLLVFDFIFLSTWLWGSGLCCARGYVLG